MLKPGENFRDVILTKDQEMPQIKEDSFKKRKKVTKNQAQSGKGCKSHSLSLKAVWLPLLSQKVPQTEMMVSAMRISSFDIED